ncbi:SCO family protein [Reichenbachiella sp. MALMAid0571]|uniref:SCO family protein n=1 Tax=Reichenbachiella sp. MALMAid0571 TaxID=3143939 RepID=UPI0032DEA63F
MIKYLKALCFMFLVMVACSCGQKKGDKLPIYGQQKIENRMEGGKTVSDTIPHTISDFSFIDQDSTVITNETFKGKIYISDFFFTSCPTICPAMKKQMLRVYDKFLENDKVSILSHTIDPAYDNVAVLKEYSERLGVKSSKWHFVTGDEQAIYDIGEKSYMVTAGADADAPGGYIHSGAFLLVDMDRRIRGVYDGTIADEVDVLMNDIERLLREYEGAK